MKKILFVLALALALTVTPASAQMPPHMGATAVAADVNLVAVLNHQNGDICNFDLANANSGVNTLKKGDSTTGTATAGNGAVTVLNSNTSGVYLEDAKTGPSAVNYEEEMKLPKFDEAGGGGMGFGNTAVAVDLNAVGIFNFNMGHVGNVLMTNANTGLNTTLKGTSDTGDALASSAVSTNLNSNTNAVSIVDSGSGPVAVNSKEFKKPQCNDDEDDCDCEDFQDPCGGAAGFPMSPMGKLAVAVDANLAVVANFNNGMVLNGVFTNANSGLNTTNKKSSDTGNATAGAVVATGLNTNDSTVVIDQSGSGSLAVNSEVRKMDRLTSKMEGSSIAVAANVNLALIVNHNDGSVFNAVMTDANTGDNATLKGNSTTGNAIASSVVGNAVNTNTNTVLVTDTSKGPSAINSDQPSSSPSSTCQPNVPCAHEGGTTAANVGTSGTAVAVDATVVGVVNDNHATVVNTTVADANTGGNTTGTDTKSCSSSPAPTSGTGNATASNSVSNTVNTNSTTVVVIK